jgi:phosphotransferase family enzyme
VNQADQVTRPRPASRRIASSVDELLADATERHPMTAGDGKSGACLERVLIGGEAYVVKHLHVDEDWIMRAQGDVRCRPLLVFEAGILDELPTCLDHAVVGAAAGLGRNSWGAALLMRDVSDLLVPEGDLPVPLEQHLSFLDHMGSLHATFWGWEDTVGLTPPTHRYGHFNPLFAKTERDTVPTLIIQGWSRFKELEETEATRGTVEGVVALMSDPTPLAEALSTPRTFLHGDWKMGNLGSSRDGRTILLDWAFPGVGCPTSELAWYLAVNAARIPHSKEDAIAAYRASLVRHGVETDSWWDRTLALSLLGALVQFGWEKARAGPGPELSWWMEHATEGLREL